MGGLRCFYRSVTIASIAISPSIWKIGIFSQLSPDDRTAEYGTTMLSVDTAPTQTPYHITTLPRSGVIIIFVFSDTRWKNEIIEEEEEKPGSLVA